VPKKARGHGHGKKRHREEDDDGLSNSDDDSPYRIDLGAWRPRISKPDIAKVARTHFNTLPQARENEVIVQFLYAVKTQGRAHGARLMVDKILKMRPEN
jgi:Sin3 binding region of histone deacetylase complex subunit SAP30